MIYKVKSKNPLTSLALLLLDEDFKFVETPKESEQELQVEVPALKYPLFCTLIGIYISFVAMRKFANETVNKLPVSDNVKKQLVKMIIQAHESNMYWKGLTSLLIIDFLTYHDSINIDGFVLFNMRGYKTEFQARLKKILSSYDESAMQQNDKNNEANSLEFLRKQIMELNLDWSLVETIHVRLNGEMLELKSDDGTLLDEDFLKKSLPNLEVRFGGDSLKPWMRVVMLLTSMCLLFPVKKVIIHKGVTKEMKQMIREEKESFSSIQTDYVFCKGCSRCDE